MALYKRKMISMLMDVMVVWLSIFLAYFLQFRGTITDAYFHQAIIYSVVTTVFAVGVFIIFKLYSRIWQYASIPETIAIVQAVVASSICSYVLTSFMLPGRIPYSIMMLSLETMILMIGGLRFARKFWYFRSNKTKKARFNTLIIGAGDCGSMIVRELQQNTDADFHPVAIIDDNPLKHRLQIYGVPIIGARDQIIHTVETLDIKHIIIAIPSAPRNEVAEIIEICKLTKAQLKIVPELKDVIEGKVQLSQLRNVEVEDLLGRAPVNVDLEGIADYVKGKTVLVTGAGGSIGSELCRQIVPFGPGSLLILGHGENSIYTIDMELRSKFPKLMIVPLIADVQDRVRMEQVFDTFRPQVVFHAAAHKHVPLMEHNPSEAIKNNVFGTMNVAECSDQFGAERFVLISSDKAVNPTNVMGVTKRIAEMIVQSMNVKSETAFTAVRFGNVLGSRGSVIPQFKEQIKRGGPVTVTHPEMVRYFMTIPEAVQLVIQAGAFARGGEVFVLDMGEPVRIVDLATDLIRLSGFKPNDDIKIAFTGIRPGEKLYEEILTAEEGVTSTKNNRIFIGKPAELDRQFLMQQIDKLTERLQESAEQIKQELKLIVPSYHRPVIEEVRQEVAVAKEPVLGGKEVLVLGTT